jgi:hypothetical protein
MKALKKVLVFIVVTVVTVVLFSTAFAAMKPDW